MSNDVQNDHPPRPPLLLAAATTTFGGDTNYKHVTDVTTPDLFDTEVRDDQPPQLNFLHVKEGDQVTKNTGDMELKMNRGSNKIGPKLDLRLNLSPPPSRVFTTVNETRNHRQSSVSPTCSCVSSEDEGVIKYTDVPEATSMVLVGCPRCLMYVMLYESDLKCPKCKSTVLLDLLHNVNNNVVVSTTTARTM
ncbi:GL2-INTERACTING REPRESSOR 2-like protein [Drosera capensis]